MTAMKEVWPTPGWGYTIRERLGGGSWKVGYRASSPYSLADVCLLYYHDETAIQVIANEVQRLLIAASKHDYASYLADFRGMTKGSDGKFFIVEELLTRPLDRVAPITDLGQFVGIGRDLCRGLTCLHETSLHVSKESDRVGVVHRDLKLDNFGLDAYQRAQSPSASFLSRWNRL